jgi:hypothetical protein
MYFRTEYIFQKRHKILLVSGYFIGSNSLRNTVSQYSSISMLGFLFKERTGFILKRHKILLVSGYFIGPASSKKYR